MQQPAETHPAPQRVRRARLIARALLTLACAVSVGLLISLAPAISARGQEATPAPAAEPAVTPESASESAPLAETPALTETAALTATAALTTALPGSAAIPAPDQACRLCHVGSNVVADAVKVLPSGEELHVGIDAAVLDASVHGVHAAADVFCTDCHQPRQRYQWPHAENPAQTLHDFEQEISANCESCHISLELHNPGHLQAQETENLPTCTDCHGGHDVIPAAALYAEPTAFCQSCHAIADMGSATQSEEQVRWAHEQLLPQLEAHEDALAAGTASQDDGPTCRTCHSDQPQLASQQCVNCHSLLDATRERGEGEPVDLHVDPNEIVASVHGDRIIEGVEYPPLGCVECHQDIAEEGFPHPEEMLLDREQLRTTVEQSCVECHQEVASQYADGIHAHAAEEGELNAASCADCHGSHNIQPPNVPRTRISETCGTCHEEIAEQYKASVHGAALYGRDNPDVPVCTDCHAAHNIADPTTAAFRLSSPQMCGDCHANVDMMEKYEISTNVFDTYLADFHGTTVTLFQHSSPHEPTNKAVCYDCHGIHDIQSVSDATEEQIQQRVLETCRKCHPDATENFPASWMSHYEPSLERYPLVYLVDLFYKIFIPTVLGGFMLFIGSDIFRRATDAGIRRREKRRGAKAVSKHAESKPVENKAAPAEEAAAPEGGAAPEDRSAPEDDQAGTTS